METKRRKFDRNFKENAVRLSYNGLSIKKNAAELKISPCVLTRWRKEYLKYGEGSFCGSGYDLVHPDEIKSFQLEKKCKASERRLAILEVGQKYLFKGDLILFEFIKQHEKKYPITIMCPVLGVGIGRYLRWKKEGLSKKKQEIIILKQEITKIFLLFNKHQGRNSVTRELHNRGYKITEEHVGFYMKQMGLRKIKKRKYKVTTDSKHQYHTAPNILNQHFKVSAPSKIWISDITYIQSIKGFLYLTIIMDLYDRKIVGYSLSTRLTMKSTTIPALLSALTDRKIPKGILFHSDRGVQYAGKDFITLLDSHKFTRSMSRKGNSFDNAVAESFFGSFKRELIYRLPPLDQKQLTNKIVEYIENWYNTTRIHSSLNYKSIEEFNSNNGQVN